MKTEMSVIPASVSRCQSGKRFWTRCFIGCSDSTRGIVIFVSTIPIFSLRLCRLTLLSLRKDACLKCILESVFVLFDVRVLFPPVSVYLLSIDFPLETHESVPMYCFLIVWEVPVPGSSPVLLDATCVHRRTVHGKHEKSRAGEHLWHAHPGEGNDGRQFPGS